MDKLCNFVAHVISNLFISDNLDVNVIQVCGQDMVSAGGRCFSLYYSRNQPITWVDSLQLCKQRGQRLASFTTAQEFYAVKTLLGRLPHDASYVFVGLHSFESQDAPAMYVSNLWIV